MPATLEHPLHAFQTTFHGGTAGLQKNDLITYDRYIHKRVWFWQVRRYLLEGWEFNGANIFTFMLWRKDPNPPRYRIIEINGPGRMTLDGACL